MASGPDISWPLFGNHDAESTFLEATASGRLHHAWLLEGASGIGKAQLARRLAGYLLGAKGPADAPLDAPTSDPVVQLMQSGGHPDLRWIARTPDDKGKLPQDIKVDQIRDLIHFFTLAPALGGWRVGVIDALDEMNRSGANAVLKTLEEPPARAILFLIYHGKAPILPTVRSRCRRLSLAHLSEDDTHAALERAGAADIGRLAALADGRPGQALKLATPQGSAAIASAEAVLKSLPRPPAAIMTDAITRAAASDEAFEAFSGRLLRWCETRAEEAPGHAEVWLDLSRILSDAREAKMDRAQTAAKLVAGLQKAPSVA
ncbi:MAG: DNA polymerase III subunit delta' [Pseudomonadota bacterium]